MTTETTCLSSIWVTDDKVKEYYAKHGKAADFKELKPADTAYYDSMIKIDLSTQGVHDCAALPPLQRVYNQRSAEKRKRAV